MDVDESVVVSPVYTKGETGLKQIVVDHENKKVRKIFYIDPAVKGYGVPLKLYRRELAALRKTGDRKHPHLVEMLGYGKEKDKIAWIDLKYVGKLTMEKVIFNRRYTYTVQTIIHYGSQILCVVGYLHEIGCVCRDLKPDNFVIDVDGNLVLIDLETLKVYINSEATNTFDFASNRYRPPESLLRYKPTYGRKGDMWAIGIIFWEMIQRRECNPEEHYEHADANPTFTVPQLRCFKAFAELVATCTKHTPILRCTAKAATIALDQIKKNPFYESYEVLPQLDMQRKCLLYPDGLGLDVVSGASIHCPSLKRRHDTPISSTDDNDTASTSKQAHTVLQPTKRSKKLVAKETAPVPDADPEPLVPSDPEYPITLSSEIFGNLDELHE